MSPGTVQRSATARISPVAAKPVGMPGAVASGGADCVLVALHGPRTSPATGRTRAS